MIEDYLCALIKCHKKFSKSIEEIKYNDYRVPVYRGVKDYQFTLEDYELNSIKQWPRLTSTSTDRRKAEQFSLGGTVKTTHLVLLKIHLCKQNDPITHVSVKNQNWSFWKDEEEIMLLPFFKF